MIGVEAMTLLPGMEPVDRHLRKLRHHPVGMAVKGASKMMDGKAGVGHPSGHCLTSPGALGLPAPVEERLGTDHEGSGHLPVAMKTCIRADMKEVPVGDIGGLKVPALACRQGRSALISYERSLQPLGRKILVHSCYPIEVKQKK